MLRTSRFPAAALAALMAVTGCTSASTPAPAATTAPTSGAATAAATQAPATPITGGSLKVGTPTEPTTLDPLIEEVLTSYLVIEQMYDQLIEWTKDLGYQPSLAESWKVADDSLSITFTLRKDVKFHSGRAMTSADVKYSIEKQREATNVHKGLYSIFGDIDTPNDNTVVFKLKEALPSVALSTLASLPSVVIDKDVVTKNGDLKRVEGGTGPFTLARWTSGSQIVLKKVADYWRKPLPYLDEIVFQIVPNESSAVAALKTGAIDWFQFSDAAVAAQIKGDSSVQYNQAPFLSYNYLGLNTTKPPFDNVKARLAVSYALNRKEIIDVTLEGLGQPTGPIVPAIATLAIPTSEYPSYTFSVDKAKSLLAEANLSGGASVDLVIVGTNAIMTAAAPVVARQLGAVGIKVNIVQVDSAIWLKHLQEWTYNGIIMGQSGGAPNPDTQLFNSFTCKGPWNYSGICNPAYDELIKKARSSVGDARAKAYADVQRMIVNDMGSYAYLFVRDQIYGWRKNVSGYTILPLVERRFETVQLAK